MVMRLSFTLDPELVDMIDQYASGRSIKRDKAILELIEAGITHVTEGGSIKIEQCRSFEEFEIIRKNINELKEEFVEMQRELRRIRHTVEREREEEAGVVPFQSKRWWKFW
ncbi:MAG: type II secretion system protein E [Methanomicrobiaceae archaeon]|nr:type II secretion system protein E [Methanomicrobiaceae archaeon]